MARLAHPKEPTGHHIVLRHDISSADCNYAAVGPFPTKTAAKNWIDSNLTYDDIDEYGDYMLGDEPVASIVPVDPIKAD